MSLFGTLVRIPCRMSATFSIVGSTATAIATWAAPGNGLRFSSLMTDDTKTIAQGLKQRDSELLDLLIEQYQFRLFRYLLHLTASRERAEDFFQETWVRVLERGAQYDGKWKFEAWLFTIARNLVLDWHRRKKPESFESLRGPEDDALEFDVKDEKGATPLESYLSAEQREGVHASLGKIPAVYREVLVLRFQEDMQLEEIAGVLSTPISTVKSRLYRGLEALRTAMTGGTAA
jgi:RNA polymerase sigma-70 factor (ECF subfamily)